MSEAGTPTRRGTFLALGGGAIVLVAAAVGITVFVEHRLHAYGHDEHGDHDDEHGPKKGKDEHDEHGTRRLELSPEVIENAKLGVQTAGPGKVSVVLSLPGELGLNAEAVAHVTPRVAGAVREVKKALGDSVKKGDVLAVLDSRELAEMQRELLAAKERLALAQANFDRQQKLWDEKISAEKDYLAAKQALAEAKIEHRSAAQKLAAGAGQGGKGAGLSLVAPIDGTIIEKHAVVGEVLDTEKLAFVVADLSSVWVTVSVYAKDLPKVREGQTALVRAEGVPEPATGQVGFVARVLGEETRSAAARIVLSNPGAAWRPGLFVTADLVVEQADAPVVVDDEAVQTVDGKEVVFVQEGHAFEARPVRLGRRGIPQDEGRPVVEVVSGIAAGERYVADNSFVLKSELGKAEAGHGH